MYHILPQIACENQVIRGIILYMREIPLSDLKQTLKQMIAKACTRVRPDALCALQNAKQSETSESAAFAMQVLLDNASLCEQKALPVCQDTGMAVFFFEIGQEVHFTGGDFEKTVNEAVAESYAENALRMSVLDPFTRINTKNNTPAVQHVRLVAGDRVKITFMPKGFGSENMTRLFMLMPADGIEGVKKAVITAIRDAGSKPCPPVFVGVGVGGTSELCLSLAKEALLRPIGTRNEREELNELEAELLREINALPIGAQGFGGNTTALAVHIKAHPTHITALPVGVNIQCNCVRSSEEVL